MGFKLAELFVDITGDDKRLNNTLAGVKSRLTGMSVALGTAAGNLATRGIEAGVAGLVGLGREAMEVQDIMSRNRTIFGDSAGLIEQMADQLAESFGVAKGEALDAASTFGQMFKGAGMGQKDAAVMGNQLTRLALDMRSFKGGATTTEESVSALAAAFRGEFDPIERFGVFLTADAVAAEAVRMKLAKSKDSVDAYGKKMAALSLIQKQTVDQQGDLSRTADQSANQWAKLTGTLQNMGTEVAGALLPAFTSLVSTINGYLAPAVERVGFVVRNFGDIWQIAQLTAKEVIDNMIARVVTWGRNVVEVVTWAATNWRTLLVDAAVAIGTALFNLQQNFMAVGEAIGRFLVDPTQGFSVEWTPILDGFEATTKTLPRLLEPTLVDMQGEIDDILGRIGAREVKFQADKAKAAADLANAKLSGERPGGGPGGKSEAGKSIGLEQFAKDLQEGVFGKDDTAKKQLAVAEKSKEIQAKQLDVLTKARAAMVAVAG